MAIYLGNTPIAENVTIQQGGGVTIDDTLSDTSKNPVQNKVINAALNNKAELTDIPTTLPANGGNADTVDGIHVSNTANTNTDNWIAAFGSTGRLQGGTALHGGLLRLWDWRDAKHWAGMQILPFVDTGQR